MGIEMKKGTIVQTTKGKIGEVVESESWVIKDTDGVSVSDSFNDKDVCDAYRIELNSEFITSKLPCLVKLGKKVFPIYPNNLKYIKTIYFKFKDLYGNIVTLRQNQSTGLILKKFLDKSNIKYYMYTSEEDMEQDVNAFL